MVNTVIPQNYTASPSSFSGTPQLTINRDVTADLDSTNAFEGTSNAHEASPYLLTRHRAREALRSMVQFLLSFDPRGHGARRIEDRPG